MSLLAGLGLGVGTYALWWYFSQQSVPRPTAPKDQRIGVGGGTALDQSPKRRTSTDSDSPAKTNLRATDFVRQEARAIGQIDPDPEVTLSRLRRFAKALDPGQYADLTKIALATHLNGDERFLAVYLLSLAESSMSLGALQEIAEASLPQQKMDSRLYDQEIIIRTQALEGLAHQGPPQQGIRRIERFISRTSNVALSGQAHRILRELQK